MGRLLKMSREQLLAECARIWPSEGAIREAERQNDHELRRGLARHRHGWWQLDDEQVDAALAVEQPGPGDHLDFVHVVEVEGREFPMYVFADLDDAQRFEAAVHAGDPPTDTHSPTYRFKEGVIVGPAAERLIASERADVLEGMGYPATAERIREGKPVAITTPDRQRELHTLLQRWAEEDAKGGQS